MKRSMIWILPATALIAGTTIGLCTPNPPTTPTFGTLPSQVSVRPVRVLVATGVTAVRASSENGLILSESDQKSPDSLPGREWIEARVAASDRIDVADRPRTGNITLASAGDAPISLDFGGENASATNYPGRMHLSVEEQGGSTLSVINEVDVEAYVACVTANEVWPDFEVEALQAQAIATRTYVLYHMLRRPNAVYDVVATQGSQVYRGMRDDTVGRRSREAAEYTRGLVSTWRVNGVDQLFCTYYSAACGGMSQSAARLGAEGDVEPLAGGVRCDYCRIAPGKNYRWGPDRIGVDEALARLTARYPELAALGRIASISVVDQTPSGRPIELRIGGDRGETRDILAERFRLAVGPSVMRSTDCSIRVTNGEVHFDNGRGFGHGLGMCQWGAQGQALQGRRAAEILAYYFPGSRLTRVY